MAELKLQVSADIRQAVAALKEFGSTLDKSGTITENTSEEIKNGLDNIGKSTNGFKDGALAVKNAATVLNDALNSTGNQLEKVGNKSYTARFAVQNLSNVIRDVPFGVNNPAIFATSLDHVVASFTMLKQEAGSLSGGLSLLGQSLAGGGGLLIGFNLLSLAATTLLPKLLGTEEEVTANTLAMANFSKILNQTKENLSDFTDQISFLNKIGKLRLDIEFGKGNLSDLIDLRGQSVSNLDLTNQLEKERDKFDKIRSALVEQLLPLLTDEQFQAFDKGILSAISDQLSDKAKNVFKALQDVETKLADTDKQLNKARNDQNVIYAQIEQKKIDITDEARKKADEAAKKALEEAKRRTKEENDALKKAMDEKRAILAEFQKDFETIGVSNLPELSKPLEQFSAKDLTSELRSKLQDALLNLANKPIIEPIKIDVPLKIQPSIQADIDKNNKFQQQIQNTLNSFNQQLKGTIQQAIVDFSSALGEGLVSGNFQQALSAIAGSIGEFLETLGKLLIETGLKVQVFKEALYTWATANPILAIGAGAALIAFGAAIKKTVLPQPKKFAKGGWVPGQGIGDTVPAMLTPGEFVVPRSQAGFVAEFLKLLGRFKSMPLSGSHNSLPLHFATGGIVPNITVNGINTDKIAPLNRIQFALSGTASRDININVNGKLQGKDIVFAVAKELQSQKGNFGRLAF